MKKEKENSGARVSFIKKDAEGKRSLSRFGKTVVICLSVIIALIAAIFISVHALVSYYYGLMEYVDIETETLLDDDEISRYLENMDEDIDPSVTDSHDSKEIESDVKQDVEKVEQEKESLDGVINILLIGVDNAGVKVWDDKYSNAHNTDAMIVASINPKTKKIVLTSLMRDTCVQIKKKDGSTAINRLNTAYLYGGYKGMFDTIGTNLGIDVDRFVQVDFSSFMSIVNIVGGIDIYVTDKEVEQLNKNVWHLNRLYGYDNGSDMLTDTSSSVKHLNGKQALAYARIRYLAGSDFARTERQRKVIIAVADKIKTLNVSQLNSLFTTLLSKVKTNLTQSECTSYIASAAEYLSYDIESFRIPDDGTCVDIVLSGREMLKVDFLENYKRWKTLLTSR